MKRTKKAQASKSAAPPPTKAVRPSAETAAAYRERLLVWAELMGRVQELDAAIVRAKADRCIDADPADEALDALKEVFLNLADAVPIRRGPD